MQSNIPTTKKVWMLVNKRLGSSRVK